MISTSDRVGGHDRVTWGHTKGALGSPPLTLTVALPLTCVHL